VFDIQITNSYGGAASLIQLNTENKSMVAADIPATLEAPLKLTNGSLPLSEAGASEESTTPTPPTTNELEQGDALSRNIRDTIDATTSRHSMSPTTTSKSASNASGSFS
jgi:hypothetical protein